jgi:OmcA/MtrC family decaheme c-type cytochrome
MRKRFALSSAAFILPLAIFASGAYAARPPAKKAIDFSATTSAAASALGKTGVVAKIQSAAIAKDGTITVRATIVDGDGNPIDRLGIATKGPVAMSFIAAYIQTGQTQYTSYTTTVLAASLNKNPSQTQAANDSGGAFSTNAVGDYTYTFKTKAPATFDATLTHSIGLTATRNLAEFGTFDTWSESYNDVYTFVPNGSAVNTTRSVVSANSCNNCHNPLNAHGGSRMKTELCVMCHSPQTVNPDTQLAMDFKVIVHKIHMGSSLPSVKAGTPYRVWHRGAWSDFSAVVFPQDVRNCTTCHAGGPAQSDNWKTNPSAAACGSCHDDVNLATGVNHAGGPQVSDSQCANCHTAKAVADFDVSIPGSHLIPENSATLPGIVAKVLKVDGATPGNAPTVTFSVLDNSGNGVDISQLTQIRVVLAGPNVDYGTGDGGIRVSEDPSKTAGSGGVYTYTMTNKIPAAGAGSYTVSIQARNTVTLMAGTTKQTTATDSGTPTEFYFSIDSSDMVARRQVVSTEKCASCHVNLKFVHGGTRSNSQECSMCHNPTLTDGTSKQSVNFAWQIHSIHRGQNLANPYVLGTTNYQEVKFPGDLRDCSTCHLGTTYRVESVGAVAPVASPGGFLASTPPIAAACQGCHDDRATASHALANTTSLGESCAVCHGVNGQFSVDSAHQRIF